MTQTHANNEWHISSYVLHCKENFADTICDYVRQIPYGEVHADDGNGKYVITLEAASTRILIDLSEDILNQKGVINLQLAYHQVDDTTEEAQPCR